jgi:glycosyltransferase involved in cell wall biosynthesis
VVPARFENDRWESASRAVVNISAVARFVHVKRLDVLLHAVSLVRSATPWELRVIGSGPLEGELKGLANDLGIADRVAFPGFRYDVPEQLASSDIFVLTSDSEGLSISIMESMAAGVPAVVTGVGGNAELVADGISGYVVPRRDPAALAERLGRLIDDIDLRRRFGKAASQRAENLFDLDIMTNQYTKLYEASSC